MGALALRRAPERGPREPVTRAEERGVAVCRYVAAAFLLLYGFAKLTGAQFTVLESELDRPMRDVPGFWLTWYYFGYSRVYGTFLALVQIAGAIALILPRFVLLGACMLFGVVGNIILIDIFYGVDLGALAAALVIQACLLRILLAHRERLAQLLLPGPVGKARHWLAIAVLSLFAFGVAYWAANYNNVIPTPIDGVWSVAQTTPGLPERVYFERARAWWCVFRYADRHEDHHFEVDPARRTVRIWRDWQLKGPLLFEGTYDPAARTMVLHGATRMELRRVRRL
jgi:hypothetical protein